MASSIRYPYQKFISEEHRASLGELYPDKTFFIIRMRNMTSGLGAILSHILRQLDYMEKTYGEDTIPVMDMSCYWNTYVEREETGIVNWWEYYFDQPTFYGIDAAYNAKNVIFNNAQFDEDWFIKPDYYDKLFDDEKYCKRMQDLWRKYIHVNGRILQKVDAVQAQIFAGANKVLGMTHRGGGYRTQISIGEPKQPTFEEELDINEEKMREWNCDHIFFATDDKIDFDIAKERFGDKLLSAPIVRYDGHVDQHARISMNRENDRYLKGEDYMMDICLLARCHCLVTARHGVAWPVLAYNGGKFEHTYNWGLGRFNRDDYIKGSFAKNVLSGYRRSTLGGAEFVVPYENYEIEV